MPEIKPSLLGRLLKALQIQLVTSSIASNCNGRNKHDKEEGSLG
jgi:hypothetical protein